jgi:hypothetical protein
MTDVERRYHDAWLGMAQPYAGLVVSVPVLVEAQCMAKQPREVQDALTSCLILSEAGTAVLTGAPRFFAEVLDLPDELFDSGNALPPPLRLYVPEGKQELRPTRALRRHSPKDIPESSADLPAAALAGLAYIALVWEVPSEVDLDAAETVTGPWSYPAQAKFDRLLRECRVPIGLLTNGRELRLVYAPHGESTGWLSFRMADMATVGGRDLIDAMVMLLGRTRWFGVSAEQQLPALLEESRRKQVSVTTALSGQVFEALEELLAGFSAASEQDRRSLLRQALETEDGHVYSGLLTVLLRLVFTLYCEDRGLLPVDKTTYAEHYSVLALYDQLERDNGRYPDSMDRRYGAYPRLVSLFRAIFLGVAHGDLHLPPRQGDLFDPNAFPFLEGWSAGSAPLTDAEARAAIDVPAVGDGTIFRALRKLILLDGQRLSYRALDVEQIGSVYEALMGFDVERLGPTGGGVRIRLGSKKGSARVWVEPARLLEVAAARRAKWLEEEFGFDKNVAGNITKAVSGAKNVEEAMTALEPLGGKARERARPGALVIQPGPERRRTGSHYTPRSLSEPIVQKTLDPLIRSLGERPSSEALLSLTICDPAVGSGAFLVAACRYLADHVVAAWTREAAEETGALPFGAQTGGEASIAGTGKTKLQLVADAHEDVVNHARRLVAQRCLYGVDKNRYAVQLARLSLWLVTMARNEPFSFVDHAIRHGDSLVGLNFDQIRAFHWEAGHKGEQIETTSGALDQALSEAIALRQRIQDLAADGSVEAHREKARLLDDARDALSRVRLVGDLVVGAFFACEKDKDRQKERNRRLDLVNRWLTTGDLAEEEALKSELCEMQAELWKTQVPFHWMVEFPEVFYRERADPLDPEKKSAVAMVEAFVGNPPFAGKNGISEQGGPAYLPWLQTTHEAAHGNADLSAHFFRRAATLLGTHGTIGLIATNTIGQGDTRATGLQRLVTMDDFRILSAIRDLPWPGDAAVTVSVVQLAKGRPSEPATLELDGRTVEAINSRLRPKPERPDPLPLASNADAAFVGTYVLGMGFTLTPEEREALIAKNAKNAQRIFPYLGGEEVNTSPIQEHDRFVISFGQMHLAQAEEWPDLLSLVREKVKPERDTNKREIRRKYWWRFGEAAPALYAAIAPLSRCLVTAIVSKHSMFSFQPVDRIFSHKLFVFPLVHPGAFSVLQSRIHTAWTWLLSSTMKTDLNYSASDCFETFPFPAEDPRAVHADLERIGERLYAARAAYMTDTEQGLTKTYNALKDPNEADRRILELRALHEQMDAAVLTAYGWSDIAVPLFCIATDADRAALQAFEDEVVDRLFLLNIERARMEAGLGLAPKNGAPSKAISGTDAPEPKPRKKQPAKKKSTEGGQGNLGW